MTIEINRKKLITRRLCLALILLLLSVLQNTDGFFPQIFGVRALLLIPAVVCMSMYERDIYGMLLGLFAGALWDTVSPLGDGYHAFLFLLVGAACGVLINTVMRNNLVTAFLLNTAAHLMYAALYAVLFVSEQGIDGAGWLFLRYFLPSALVSVLFTPIVYLLVRFVMRRTRIR